MRGSDNRFEILRRIVVFFCIFTCGVFGIFWAKEMLFNHFAIDNQVSEIKEIEMEMKTENQNDEVCNFEKPLETNLDTKEFIKKIDDVPVDSPPIQSCDKESVFCLSENSESLCGNEASLCENESVLYLNKNIGLLKSAIESIFGIKVDNGLKIDFKKLEMIIDKLGGIDLDLSEEDVAYVNKYSSKGHLNGSGMMHLNGNQVIQFSRDRNNPNADFSGTKHQRIVVNAIIRKIQSIGAVRMAPIAAEIIHLIGADVVRAKINSWAKECKALADCSVFMNKISKKSE